MKTYKSIFFILLLLIGHHSLSQEISLEGSVKNAVTGDVISGAIVSIENTNCKTQSDANGYFSFQCKLPVKPIIVVSHLSYKDNREEITTKAIDNKVTIHLTMYPETQKLHEIEVRGKYSDKVPYTVEKISLHKIDETNNSDIGKLITDEPNIGGVKKGSVGIDPVIRGFKYSQISVQLNDGTKIEGGCPNRMDPSASHVNINDLASITIYKGPFALKYGPGFGGLVILETFKPVFNEKFNNSIGIIIGGQTNHQGYRSGIKINGGSKRISYLFTANRNKYGNYSSGNGDVFKAASDNYNITGSLGLLISSGHSITFGVDRSWGRNIDFPTLPMDERSDDTRILNFGYLGTNISNTINFIKLTAYNSYVDHEMDNKNRPFSDTVVAISKIAATNSGGRLSVNMNSFGGIGEVGTTFEHITKDGNRYKNLIMQPNLPVIEENLWNNAIISNLGVYGEYKIKKNNFDWIAALRFDYNMATSGPMLRIKKDGTVVYENNNTDSEYFNFSASAGMSWQFTSKSALTVSIGKGTRSPDMTERFIILLPVGYDPYDYLGNPDLVPENNHELDLGIERICSRSGQFNASVFFSYVTDYISAVIVPPSQIKPQTKGVFGVKQFINIEKAFLTGFEVKHSTPIENIWQVRFNVAYTMGMNPHATKVNYENGEATGEEVIKNDPLPEIPPLEANLYFNYKLLKRKLVPELHYRIVAKQSNISQAYYESETPGFNLLNFRLVYSYNENLNITFGINNIFNTNYYEHLSRRIVGSKTPFYEPGRIFYTNLIIKI